MPRPDRSLRRLVAQLAGLDREDVDAILESLPDVDRCAIDDLLREFIALPDIRAETGPCRTPEPEFDASRLSPWLVAVINGTQSDPATTRVCRTLREHALQKYPAPAPILDEPAKTRFRSIFPRRGEKPCAES